MKGWKVIASVALASGLAGCMHAYPEYVTLRPVSAPPEEAPFVVVYDPNLTSEWKVTPRGNVPLLTRLDDVVVTCTNTPCELDRDTMRIVLAKPAPGIKQVDVLVSKEGFEPVRFVVPFDGQPWPGRLVLMRRNDEMQKARTQ
jgi:hypothetical protein